MTGRTRPQEPSAGGPSSPTPQSPGTVDPSARRPHLRLVPPPAPDPVRRRRPASPGPGQQLLELEFALADGSAAPPVIPRRLRVVGPDDDFGHRPTSRNELPPAGAWVARLAVALVETLHGQRPAGQLVRWTTHDVLAALQERSSARQRHPSAAARRRAGGPATAPVIGSIGGPRYTVRSMRVEEPADGIVEATVLLTGPGRPIPLAIRLEGLDGRWICTVVDSPDRTVTGTAPDVRRTNRPDDD